MRATYDTVFSADMGDLTFDVGKNAMGHSISDPNSRIKINASNLTTDRGVSQPL